MAGGAIIGGGVAGRQDLYQRNITWHVIMTCIVAGSGGLLFGYDNGVTGGVTAFPAFLKKFFPTVYTQSQAAANTNSAYCKFDDHALQAFTSSLYLAGCVSSVFGSWTTSHMGRKTTMVSAGIFFLIGAVLVSNAVDLAMLIIGRIMLGFGVGLANQSVPLYLSEVAPFHWRGAMNIMFQLSVTIGILAAQLINYGTQYIEPWGWQLSLGLAGVPAIFLAVGSSLLPESPNSLIERNKHAEGRAILEKLRNSKDVDAEYEDICTAAFAASQVKHPFRTILQRRYRPQLVLALAIPIFQQLTGINAIVFYAPQLFSSLGSGNEGALLTTVIIGAVNVVSTLVSIVMVDRAGRKILFIEGGIQMTVAQVTVAGVLGAKFASGVLDNPSTIAVIVLICIFVAGFAWSWGPLAWLVPTEIQPLETRSAGQAITVVANFLLTFIIGQCFLSMLCSMEYGIFLFFAGFCIIMTIFVIFFVPETRGVPIEEIMAVSFGQHWFWKRFSADPAAIAATGIVPAEVALGTHAPVANKKVGAMNGVPQDVNNVYDRDQAPRM